MNNKQIKFTYDGEEYTLEYNRAAIKLMEAQGFDINEFQRKPMTNLELAFRGAFYKNHKQTTFTVIDEIITHFKNKQKLIAVLSEMIAESYNSLLGEPAKDDSKNIEWETVELNPVENNK